MYMFESGISSTCTNYIYWGASARVYLPNID